jgi:hypothetical protein
MVGFPLLLIPLAIYNIIVFLMPDVSFTDPLVKLTLMSGAEWTVTLSDVLLTLAILLLLAEVIKGARPGAKYLTDHPAVADRVRRGGGRIRAVAEIRHLDLFPDDGLSLVDFLSGLALRTRRRAVAVAAAPAPPPKRRKSRGPTGPARTEPAPASAHLPCRRPRRRPAALCRRIRAAGSPEPKPVAAAVSPEAARSCLRRLRRKLLHTEVITRKPFTGNSVAGDCSQAPSSASPGQAGHASACSS